MKFFKKILKNIYLILFCNIFINVKIGKKSYIRGHRLLHGNKYIKIGNNVKIYSYARIECYDSYGGSKYEPSIMIEDNVMINRYCTLLSAGKLVIGKNTCMGSFVFISNENHGTQICEKSFLSQPLDTKDIVIGENCWIGEKAIILPGVTIGDNSIIGAGSVVTKSIPANSMACGNPARVIKHYDFELKKWVRV